MKMPTTSRKIVTILFDENKSESWTISLQRAKEINPARPSNSSYATAASILERREFELRRNIDKQLTATILKRADLLVMLHPCDSKWENTTSTGSPKLSKIEIKSIQSHVESGGSLLIITEYEHDKYDSNVNDLLRPFGITVTNATVTDRTNHATGNPTWVLADLTAGDNGTQLLHLVTDACFYRAGACQTNPPARAAICASTSSSPHRAQLVAVSEYGAGRVAVVTDSDLFGDEFIDSLGHRQLWINLIYWLCLPTFKTRCNVGMKTAKMSRSNGKEIWSQVKNLVNTLRQLQRPNGSISEADSDRVSAEARSCINTLTDLLPRLKPYFSHQVEYLTAVATDLERWKDENFDKPDFTRSLKAFNPQLPRHDNLCHFVLFPMYTPNASLDTKIEALVIETLWPDWLAAIHTTNYQDNDKFVPAKLIDYSDGYASECAVLFAEIISIAGHNDNRFGIIFCNREATRYQEIVGRALSIVRLEMPPLLQAFIANLEIILETYALWDLIHDTSHGRGELPFDPFMVRQKSPFWMYALEELRVDLRSFLEADRLSSKYPIAGYVCYAMLFDRIFRFPVSGNRVRNYDALAGQLLFNALHAKNVIMWRDNVLSINWPELDHSIQDIYTELQALYWAGQVMSKVAYWSAAYDLLCRYMTPNVASKWVASLRVLEDENDPKHLISLVHNDEFPLGNFHLFLKRKLALA